MYGSSFAGCVEPLVSSAVLVVCRITAAGAFNDLTPAEANWTLLAVIRTIIGVLTHLRKHMIPLTFQCFVQPVDIPLPSPCAADCITATCIAETSTAARDGFSI